jgi:hypothetical protein
MQPADGMGSGGADALMLTGAARMTCALVLVLAFSAHVLHV